MIDDETTTPNPTTAAPAGLLSALPHVAIVLAVVIGAIVLCALGQLSGTITAGILGVALGGSGTVAAANLTPSA